MLSPLHLIQHKKLAQQIAELAETLEELKSEQAILLERLPMKNEEPPAFLQVNILDVETTLADLDDRTIRYQSKLDTAQAEYHDLTDYVDDSQKAELYALRQAIRPEKENAAIQKVRSAYGRQFNSTFIIKNRNFISDLLKDFSNNKEIQGIRIKLATSKIKKHQQER